jgi:gamma-glutamyltranspeptidase
MRILWFGEGIKQAVDAHRIHHQIFPMELAYDYGVLDVSTPLMQGTLGRKLAKCDC